MKMSEGQEFIYNAIKDYIQKNGYSPSTRDICELTNKKSSATIHHYLKALKRKGYITYEENKARTIRILK